MALQFLARLLATLFRQSKSEHQNSQTLISQLSQKRPKDWERAIRLPKRPFAIDEALLTDLVDNEPPGQALSELEGTIDSLHCISSADPGFKDKITEKIRHLEPYVNRVRDKLGWRVREFDLQLLQQCRRGGCLSVVLGAGASMAAPCGAPSWAGLVKEILQSTLEQGCQVRQISAGDLAKAPPDMLTILRALPFALPEFNVGVEPPNNSGSFDFNFEVKEVKRYNDEQEARARNILGAIENGDTEPETLTRGVDVCYELCGQRLFVLITRILYENSRQPSTIHKMIARLAKVGVGWYSIFTYNFDSFMEIALTDAGVPNAGWAMRGGHMAVDPCLLAIENERRNPFAWHQAVYHLHGYTPEKLFNIGEVAFVFASSQFENCYNVNKPAPPILQLAGENLQKPNHITLYVGCSFTDKYMNGLLKAAVNQQYGRYHYALMKWPTKRDGREPTADEIKDASRPYLEIGVRPIWFDEFGEEPALLARLA